MTMSMASIASALALALPGYTEVARNHDVVVMQREGSTVIDLVAEGDFAAPPERLLALLLAYDRHAGLVRGVSESRVLARGPNEVVVYQRLSLPIISDRDVTLRVTFGADGDVRWLKFAACNQRGPGPVDGVVRIPVDEGGWQLVPIEGGRGTRARYSLRLDLAGSLPKWLGRGRAGSDIPDLFETFRKQLR